MGVGTFPPSFGATLKPIEMISQFPVLRSPASMPRASRLFCPVVRRPRASNRVALYAVYPKGIVQVVMAGPGTFLGAPTQQLIAVLRLVTHKE